jgi:hypothetical protein
MSNTDDHSTNVENATNVENEIFGGAMLKEIPIIYTLYETVTTFFKNINPLTLLTLFYITVFLVVYFFYREPIQYWYKNTLREKILEWSVYLKLNQSGTRIQSVRYNSKHRPIDSWLEYFETQLGLAT